MGVRGGQKMAIVPYIMYLLKMSIGSGVGGSKKAKIPLRNIKMVPKYMQPRIAARLLNKVGRFCLYSQR